MKIINKMTRYFTWNEFDKSVDYIAKKSNKLKLSGIYGIPRGGLCLAVALSHKLNVKIIETPLRNSLIVDDIYETGHTLNTFRNIEGVSFFVLFSKQKPIWWNTVNLSKDNEWIVFPWENTKTTLIDQNEYKNKRGLI